MFLFFFVVGKLSFNVCFEGLWCCLMVCNGLMVMLSGVVVLFFLCVCGFGVRLMVFMVCVI